MIPAASIFHLFPCKFVTSMVSLDSANHALVVDITMPCDSMVQYCSVWLNDGAKMNRWLW